MDAKEIDKLEGRALDAAVAEHVMGCKWVQISEHERGLVVGRDHKYLMVGVLVRDDDDRPTYVDNLPAYSLDWREAGKVAEHLGTLHLAHSGATGEWQASYCDAINSDAHGKTAPLAICRAALKAVMP